MFLCGDPSLTHPTLHHVIRWHWVGGTVPPTHASCVSASKAPLRCTAASPQAILDASSAASVYPAAFVAVPAEQRAGAAGLDPASPHARAWHRLVPSLFGCQVRWNGDVGTGQIVGAADIGEKGGSVQRQAAWVGSRESQ